MSNNNIFLILSYRVLQLDKAYAPSFNGRGLVWDRFYNFEEAINDFSKAIELDQ